MKHSLRWGILGTGGIARAFAKDITNFTSQKISAIGSRDLNKASAFAVDFGAQPLGSYEELVNSDVDAIYVATPHPLHAPNSLLALHAGKPVLCEKPFAVNAKEASEMISKARSRNLLLMEAMWSRYLPHYIAIREIVRSGELGDVFQVIGDHGQPLPAHTHHRLHAPELAGGALLDLGIYPLSLAYMVLGRPNQIKAVGTKTISGVDATTSAVLHFHTGAQATITTTLTTKTPCAASIIGTKGRIEIDGDFYTPTTFRTILYGGKKQEYENNYRGHGLREQALYFEKLLNDGKIESDVLPLDETLSIMETMDEMRSQIGVRYPFE